MRYRQRFRPETLWNRFFVPRLVNVLQVINITPEFLLESWMFITKDLCLVFVWWFGHSSFTWCSVFWTFGSWGFYMLQFGIRLLGGFHIRSFWYTYFSWPFGIFVWQVFYDSFDENFEGRWVVSQSSDYGGTIIIPIFLSCFFQWCVGFYRMLRFQYYSLKFRCECGPLSWNVPPIVLFRLKACYG